MDQGLLALALIGLQVVWGLVLLLLNFSVKRLVRDLDENTAATSMMSSKLTDLNLSLVTNFVIKEDWTYIRERVHALGDQVNQVITREQMRDRMQERNRREGEHS